MLRRFISIVLCVICLCVSVSADEKQLDSLPWLIEVPASPPSVLADFVARLRAPTFEAMPRYLAASAEPEPVVPEFWKGNNPTFAMQLSKLSFHFRLRDDADVPLFGAEKLPPPVQTFEMTLSVTPRGYLFKHSEAKRSEQAGGILMSTRAKDPQKFLLEGKGQSSVALLLAPQPSADSVSFLLCPRFFPTIVEKGGQVVMDPSPYDLLSVTYGYTVDAKAHVLTGTQGGNAHIKLLTSALVAHSEPWQDVAAGIDPRVDIHYVPDKSFVAEVRPTAENFDAALKVESQLSALSGYERISTRTNVVWIRKVNLDSALSLPVHGGVIMDTAFAAYVPERARSAHTRYGIDVWVQPGTCHMIHNETSPIRHAYQKLKAAEVP